MRKILVATFIILALSISPCAIAYDAKPGTFTEWLTDAGNIKDLCTSVVSVHTWGHGEGFYPNDKNEWELARGAFEMEGMGVVVRGSHGQKYVITARHVVVPNDVTIQLTAWSFWNTTLVTIISRTISVGDGDGMVPAYITYMPENSDLVILAIHKAPALDPIPYKAAETWAFGYGERLDYLNRDEALAIVTHARTEEGETSWTYEVRTGRMISESVELPSINDLPWFSLGHFTMDLEVFPGDSGAPVFAFENGKPVLIGVASAICLICPETRSYAVRIDPVLRFLGT